MATNYEIEYCLSDSQKSNIWQTCSVQLLVKWNNGTQQKTFFHCLHCKTTFSRTGLHYHKITFTLTPQEKHEIVAEFLANPVRQQMIIREEFEKRFSEGELKRGSFNSPSQRYTFDFVPHPNPPVRRRIQQRQRPRYVLQPQNTNDFPQQELDFPERVDQDEARDPYPDLEDCFSSDGFNPERFEVFARDFLRRGQETFDQDVELLEKEKAKIVSTLAQNLYMICTLSKDQIKISRVSGR